MTNQEREQIALFRYALIAPLFNNQVSSQKEYLAEICGKVHDVPYYGRKDFAPKTILGWLRAYRKFGFPALKPKERTDKGTSRKLSPVLITDILLTRRQYRDFSVMLFYEKLIQEGIILPENVSYHTIYRLLKRENLLEVDDRSVNERKRFAYDQVNILWQGDMSVGPYLVINRKKFKTILVAFLDDCSRLVPFAQFFYFERFDSIKTVLKEALIRRGIPKMIYVDNGKVYHAEQLHLACAQLGITLTHTQPYDPQSKGKIERFFGTVRRRFYPLLAQEPPQSLEELNQRFWQWLEQDYHRKVHSSTGMCPLDLFMSQASSVRMVSDPAALEPLFWKREWRKVKSDATISLQNRLFEVPLQLIGQKIEIRFDPATLEIVHIFEDDRPMYVAKPVSFQDNAKMKRQHKVEKEATISFGDLLACPQEEC